MRCRLLIAIGSFAIFYAVLMGIALHPQLPSEQHRLIFYSNQQRDDFRLVLKNAFARARSSIDVTMYTISDPELLTLLHRKALEGLKVTLRYDKKGGSLPIPAPIKPIPIKGKGLMHRKIVIVDNVSVFLGSANMTTSSLVLHDNLSVGIYHPPLAQFLLAPDRLHFIFDYGEIRLLPDPEALAHVEAALNRATTSIFVAMFTLTHPLLLDTLARAKERGVDVTIAVDHYAARGASRKAVRYLKEQGVKVVFSQGLQLLHHKWAYIDRREVVLGSTNWTKAAFTKNQDCLLFLPALTEKEKRLFDDLSGTILLESIEKL